MSDVRYFGEIIFCSGWDDKISPIVEIIRFYDTSSNSQPLKWDQIKNPNLDTFTGYVAIDRDCCSIEWDEGIDHPDEIKLPAEDFRKFWKE